MSLCKYRDIFGKVNEGPHSYRFLGIAIVDLVLTILAAIAISKWKGYPFHWTFFGLMVSGLLLHKLFCVDTTLTVLVFGKN